MAFVQSKLSTVSSAPSLNLTYDSSNTSGNFLTLLSSTTVPITGITDTNNNSWHVDINGTSDPFGVIGSAYNCGGGANTVTVLFSGNAFATVDIAEYSNVLISGALDKTATAQGFSVGLLNTPAVSTTFNDELLIANFSTLQIDSSELVFAGSGWTPRTTGFGVRILFHEDRTVSTSGNYSGVATLTTQVSDSRGYVISLATYKLQTVVTGITSYATGNLAFYGSQLMQANSTGLIGGAIDLSQSVNFRSPTIALNVNDRVRVVSTSAADTGIAVNLIGRGTAGVLQSEAISLNGLVSGTGLLTYSHILRSFIPLHTGEVTVSRLGDSSGIFVFPSGATGVNRLLSRAKQNELSYDKIFLKNIGQSSAALNVFVAETLNPSGSCAFAIATGKGDNETIANYNVAPTGCSTFSNASKFIPTTYLRTGEAIGIWVRASGQQFTDFYSLGAYAAIAGTGS